MKITNVRLFQLEGPLRSGLAHYDDPRFDRGPAKPQPYRDVFCEIETDVGVTGFSFAGSSEIWPVVRSMRGEIIAPHACESCIPNVHLLFAQASRTCPLAEYNVRVNAHRQSFYKTFVAPKDGYFEQPIVPGLGWEFDPGKVVNRIEL